MATRQKHQLVAGDLISRLQSGEWTVGEKFPTVDDILGDYEYSRGTVFKGISNLIDDGYLEVRKGVGTFVVRVSPCQTIGLLMSEAAFQPQATPFPYYLGNKIVEILSANNFSIKRFTECAGNSGDALLNIEGLEEDLRKGILRGMIMANCNFPMHVNSSSLWQKYGVPFVSINTYGDNPFHVKMDFMDLTEKALRFFESKGRKHAALICSDDFVPLVQSITQHDPGLQVSEAHTVVLYTSDNIERDGYNALINLWRNTHEKPDALFVTDDIAMKGVAQAVLALRLNIPDDLLLLTSANSDTGVFYPIQMAKLEFDLNKMAMESVSLLQQILNNTNGLQGQTRKIQPRLIINN
jgi:DNA-binding LacI/PurR family transcriptional regulator